MAEHVDDLRLHTDPRYRFDYISKFLNFTQNDITMLNVLAPIIFPSVPVIIDTIYRKLFSYDVTKQYFIVRNQGFENFAATKDSNLALDSAQMLYRKDMLSMYLKRLLTQTEWNDAFLQYMTQVGQMHANKSGAGSINVDYIHINALFGFIEHLLVDKLWNMDGIDDKKKHDMIIAVNKLFWIQNDIFSMQYGTSSSNKSFPVESTKMNPTCCCLLH
ncbi:unnamed protein product [Rotaria magnacalcarata]|uniref:Globin-sensor domain-containing protein n=1 Tax=Rotaria magnacalcarata TaxID=392030 RepID=A0A817AK57_9BILA|nr:unnamed protein product [Rotaria magnacalcarata]CAF4107640.1 unnamed protein product [Rotaria magnacalcarata]